MVCRHCDVMFYGVDIGSDEPCKTRTCICVLRNVQNGALMLITKAEAARLSSRYPTFEDKQKDDALVRLKDGHLQ